MGMAAILFNDVESFVQIDNTPYEICQELVKLFQRCLKIIIF